MASSYQAITTIKNVPANAQAYSLITSPGAGANLLATWSCVRTPNNLVAGTWTVTQVDTNGAAILDAHGNAIVGMAHEQTTVQAIQALTSGIATFKQQLLDIAMGDPGAVRQVPDDIRDAIQAASFLS